MHATIAFEGRLVADPEFRVGKDDREFCSLRMVVNQKLGEKENATFFHCTGKEFLSNRLKKAGLSKGRLLNVVGNLALQEYVDRNGITRSSLEVSMLDWYFSGPKPKAPGDDAAPAGQTPTGSVENEVYLDDDDDLPV